MQVALRLEHVPFPVIVEQSPENRTPELDRQRRRAVVELLRRGTACGMLPPIDDIDFISPAKL